MVGIISLAFTVLGALLAERMMKSLVVPKRTLVFIIFEAVLLGILALSAHKIILWP